MKPIKRKSSAALALLKKTRDIDKELKALKMPADSGTVIALLNEKCDLVISYIQKLAGVSNH